MMMSRFVTLELFGWTFVAISWFATVARSLLHRCGPSLLPEGPAWPATSVAASP